MRICSALSPGNTRQHLNPGVFGIFVSVFLSAEVAEHHFHPSCVYFQLFEFNDCCPVFTLTFNTVLILLSDIKSYPEFQHFLFFFHFHSAAVVFSRGLSTCLIPSCSVVWASQPVELQIRLDLKEESSCCRGSSSVTEEWQNLSLSLSLFPRPPFAVSLCVTGHLLLFTSPSWLSFLSLHSGKGGLTLFKRKKKINI